MVYAALSASLSDRLPARRVSAGCGSIRSRPIRSASRMLPLVRGRVRDSSAARPDPARSSFRPNRSRPERQRGCAGLDASAVAHRPGERPALGWGTLWQLVVMSLGGAACHAGVLLRCSTGCTETLGPRAACWKPASGPTAKSGGDDDERSRRLLNRHCFRPTEKRTIRNCAAVALVVSGGLGRLAGRACGGCKSCPRGIIRSRSKRSRFARCGSRRCAGEFWTATARCWRKTGRLTTSACISRNCANHLTPRISRNCARAKAVPRTRAGATAATTGTPAHQARTQTVLCFPPQIETWLREARPE